VQKDRFDQLYNAEFAFFSFHKLLKEDPQFVKVLEEFNNQVDFQSMRSALTFEDQKNLRFISTVISRFTRESF